MQDVFNVSVGVGGTVDVLERTVSRGLNNGIPSEIDSRVRERRERGGAREKEKAREREK